MPATPRGQVFDPTVVGVYHAYNRCVRRAFLMGYDEYLELSFDHRKDWGRDRLRELAAGFAIDILDYAIMDNHFHLMLRNRPDIVVALTDEQVARRWWQICPSRRNPDRSVPEPLPCELNLWLSDPEQMTELRSRLSDISWLLRLFSQNLARRANAEDEVTGKFFESRFDCDRIVDEAGLLACCIYVDLNPIRAGKAFTPETSEYTGAWDRIRARWQETQALLGRPTTLEWAPEAWRDADDWLAPLFLAPEPVRLEADSPVPIDLPVPLHAIGPAAMTSPATGLDGTAHEPAAPASVRTLATPFPSPRASNTGFLSLTLERYLQLLDWTGRELRADKRGAIPADLPPILERLGIQPDRWLDLIGNLRVWFGQAVGRPSSLRKEAERRHRKTLRGLGAAAAAFT